MSILILWPGSRRRRHFPRKNAGRARVRAPGPSRGQTRAEQGPYQEKILAVALELFRKHGLEGTTTKQISRRVGIAEGTLFKLLPDQGGAGALLLPAGDGDLIAHYRGGRPAGVRALPEEALALIQRDLESMAPYEQFIGPVIFRALQPGLQVASG